jgi:large subunit ribosomal protein L6
MHSIEIPKHVKVYLGKGFIKLEGPKGILIKKTGDLQFVIKASRIYVLHSKNISTKDVAFYVVVLTKLLHGIERGFRERLRIVGVGFKALVQNSNLQLKLGYSHLIEWKIPKTIQIVCSKLKGTVLLIKGNEPYKVSQIATQIREFRVPDVYKGKGIKKDNEILVLKKGKRESK